MKKRLLIIFFFLSAQYAYACTGPSGNCHLDSDCCTQDNLICLVTTISSSCQNPLNATCYHNGQLGGQWYTGDKVTRQCPSNETCITQTGGSTRIPCFAPSPTPIPQPTLAPCNSPAFCSLDSCPTGFHRDALQFACPSAINPDFQTYCCVSDTVPTLTPTPTPIPCGGSCRTTCDTSV